MAAPLPTFRLSASELPYRAGVAVIGPPECPKILVGATLFGGHNQPPLLGIGLTNMLKYGEDQSSYVPAALNRYLDFTEKTAAGDGAAVLPVVPHCYFRIF